MKTISWRHFRENVDTIGEPVNVQRRDKSGNFQVLGYWTPYKQWDAGASLPPISGIVPAAPLEDQPPVLGGTTGIEDGQYVRIDPVPPGSRRLVDDDNELLPRSGGAMSTIDEVELRRRGMTAAPLEVLDIGPNATKGDVDRVRERFVQGFGVPKPAPKTIRKRR